MSHYQTLGIAEDADAEAIKQAFRSKAKNLHPDKGGSHEDMSTLNKAYAVLSDPERKAQYDTTGNDTVEDSAVAASGVLAQLFSQALSSRTPDILGFVKGHIQRAINAQADEIRGTKQAIEFLTSQRDKITVASGDNLFQSLVDQQLEGAQNNLLSVQRQLRSLELAMTLVKTYVSTQVSEPVSTQTARQRAYERVYYGTSTSTSI